MGSGDDEAEVVATVGSISGSVSIQASHPEIAVRIVPQSDTIYKGHSIAYQYQVTNTGDTTLSQVTLVDDNGTPENPADDWSGCVVTSFAPGATTSCTHTITLTQTMTIVATATGQDALGSLVNDSDRTTTAVISPGIDLLVTADRMIIFTEQDVTYRYQVTNTGDTELRQVIVEDDNGTPGGVYVPVCARDKLAPGATTSCTRTTELAQTTTTTARTTGRDLLGTAWTVSDRVTVKVEVHIYLPIVTRR